MPVSTLNGQELQIFRAGNYGEKGAYSRADLQQLASSYDPAKHEVPLVIGHPKVNAPAFGWLKSMRADGDLLFGTFEKVPPVMDRLVDSGAYRKRSVGLRRLPDGKLEMRHVGYLGAMPPEVQGLMDATFADESFAEIEFSAAPGDDMPEPTQQELKKTIMDSIREFFSGPAGSGDKPGTADLSALEQRLEQKFNASLAAKDAEIATLTAQQANFASEHAKSTTQQRIDSAVATLKGNKRWLPAFDRMGALEVFAALGASTTQEITFSSGDGKNRKEEKLDPVTMFARFLNGLGQIVPEGQQFNAVDTTAVVPAVVVPEGVAVDPGSAQFESAIQARMTERKIDRQAAFRQLTAEGKSSAAYAGASAGAV